MTKSLPESKPMLDDSTPQQDVRNPDLRAAEPERATHPQPKSRRGRVWLWSLVLTVVALGVAAFVWFGAGEYGAGTASEPKVARAAVVRIAHVVQRDMVVHHDYRGELVADVAELSAQTVGELREVRVQLGDVVRKDQVLALVDAALARRQLNEAQAQVQVAQAEQARAAAELSTAQVERNRADALLREQLITEQEAVAARARIDVLQAQVASAKAQAAQAQARVSLLAAGLAQTRILAPFDGAVAQRYLDPGAVVQPGTPILRVVADGHLRVRFRVPENALALVDVGQPLTLTTQSSAGESFEGKVTRRSAEVSPVDRSVAVEGELKERTPRLLPGMYARVTVSADVLRDALVVPNPALVERYRDGRSQSGVYVVDRTEDGAATNENGQATVQFVPVNVRGNDSAFAAIEPLTEQVPGGALSGLTPGSQVIVSGADVLSDGAPVRVLDQDKPAEPATPASAEPIVR